MLLSKSVMLRTAGLLLLLTAVAIASAGRRNEPAPVSAPLTPTPAPTWPAPDKQDMRMPAPDEPLFPRRVTTETIRLDGWRAPAPPLPEVRLASDPMPRAAPLTPRHRTIRAKRPARDVCARHGMRKIVTRGGRSWNCRRR